MKLRILMSCVLLAVSTGASAAEGDDKAAIKTLLYDNYLAGIYTDQDANLVRELFHPDFVLTVAVEDYVEYLPLEGWIDYEGLNLAEIDKSDEVKAKRTATLDIKSIDVVGNVATVKAEVSIDGELTYTNFYGMAKTAGKWQVVNKHFAIHGNH